MYLHSRCQSFHMMYRPTKWLSRRRHATLRSTAEKRVLHKHIIFLSSNESEIRDSVLKCLRVPVAANWAKRARGLRCAGCQKFDATHITCGNATSAPSLETLLRFNHSNIISSRFVPFPLLCRTMILVWKHLAVSKSSRLVLFVLTLY